MSGLPGAPVSRPVRPSGKNAPFCIFMVITLLICVKGVASLCQRQVQGSNWCGKKLQGHDAGPLSAAGTHL